VVLAARYVGPELNRFVEDKPENWLGLEINREKTRVVNLKERGAGLDFPGFTFRCYRSLKGSGRYLNVSAKALEKEREKLKEMTGPNSLGELLPLRVSAGDIPGDQPVRSRPSQADSETTQPAALHRATA
jgi:RNA-directed DNA polymerase